METSIIHIPKLTYERAKYLFPWLRHNRFFPGEPIKMLTILGTLPPARGENFFTHWCDGYLFDFYSFDRFGEPCAILLHWAFGSWIQVRVDFDEIRRAS